MPLKPITKPEVNIGNIIKDLSNNDSFSEFEKLIHLLGDKESKDIYNELNIDKVKTIEEAIKNYEELSSEKEVHNNSNNNRNLLKLNVLLSSLNELK